MPTVPVLSIVVPAYQEGAALAQALHGIAEAARETELPFELIVIDDGSNDTTWDAIVTVGSRVVEVIGVRLSTCTARTKRGVRVRAIPASTNGRRRCPQPRGIRSSRSTSTW